MKKFTLLSLALATITSATYAEGYQVNTLSAKQLGMAHTGVSQKLNSESVWFNPAAAAFQEQKFSISAGVAGIAAVADWESVDGTQSHTSDNKLSTPIYINANYKITEDLAVGVTFNTPYGSSMNWGDSWAGQDQVQSISLQAYNIQPTVSYKLLDGRLSVGAGAMISWGSFELSKALFTADQSTALGGAVSSATLSGDAEFTFGVNAGVMFDISDKWSVGASYRSKMMMVVEEGSTVCSFNNDAYRDYVVSNGVNLADLMENYSFAAELPMPSTLSVGVSYSPNEDWLISAELQRVGWATYETLNFDYSGVFNSEATKDYDNTYIYRLGAQYNALSWLTARAGFYYDQSPVQDEYFTPETPSMNKLGYTCGVSLNLCSNLSIDLAYAYIAPAESERKSTYDSFSGTYKAVANVGSIGITVGF